MPADFTFNVKAFRAFTLHPCGIDSFPSDVRQELSTTSSEFSIRSREGHILQFGNVPFFVVGPKQARVHAEYAASVACARSEVPPTV